MVGGLHMHRRLFFLVLEKPFCYKVMMRDRSTVAVTSIGGICGSGLPCINTVTVRLFSMLCTIGNMRWSDVLSSWSPCKSSCHATVLKGTNAAKTRKRTKSHRNNTRYLVQVESVCIHQEESNGR